MNYVCGMSNSSFLSPLLANTDVLRQLVLNNGGISFSNKLPRNFFIISLT